MKRKILIVGQHFPESKSTAAGRKMMQWLEFFQQEQAEVYYASTSPMNDFSDDLAHFVQATHSIQVNDSSFNQFVRELAPTIVLYDRFTSEEQFGWRIREEISTAIHLLETQDIHFLREARQKKISIFNEVTKREIASILRCDLTSIISEYEMKLLQENFPYLIHQIFYFPLCYSIGGQLKSVSSRMDFCFIGNFHHAPNREAVLWLKEHWKAIRKFLPDAKLFVYGAYPNQQIEQLHSAKEGFLIQGRASSVKEVFERHKVLLAPIRFGAGLKGKLLEAMQYGIVSVTTPVGAEGISDMENWNGKVVELEDFIETAVAVYTNDGAYQMYQKKGEKILKESFYSSLYHSRIAQKINLVQEDVKAWRQQNFLSEIVNHHRQQSVRYLSKWIEAKNSNGK